MTDDDKTLVARLRWSASGKVGAEQARLERNAADRIEAQAAEIEKLREALKHQGGPLCMARYHPTAECTCGVSAALGETK